tara:strand:- start:24690 stop:24851 length:162 start_codon:yes stop_codon:yes gene_type:complete
MIGSFVLICIVAWLIVLILICNENINSRGIVYPTLLSALSMILLTILKIKGLV